MTLQESLHQGTKLLEEAAISAPRLTAEVLLSHAIGCRREWLYAHATDELIPLWWIHYGRYLHERLKGKPTQYITKVQEFYGRDFRVSPTVLIPRPETEHLIEAALPKLTPQSLVIDVGTGSGAIAVTLALETRAQLYACDLSAQALAVAQTNARKLKAQIHFAQADLLTATKPNSLDMVVSNPPYIPLDESPTLAKEVIDHEPHLALFGGSDGLTIYRRLIAQAAAVLKPRGWLVMEIAYNGADKTKALLAPSQWTNIEIIPDLAGHPRVIMAQSANESI